MASPDYLREVDEVLRRRASPEAPSVLQAPSEAPYTDLLDNLDEFRARRVALALQLGRQDDPERHARVLRVQARTGYPAAVVAPNLEALERAPDDTDYAALVRRSPGVMRWLEENPSHAGIAQDDLSSLSSLEWAMRAGIGALRVGVGQAEFGARTFAQKLSADLKHQSPLALAVAKAGAETVRQRADQADREVEIGPVNAATGLAAQLARRFVSTLSLGPEENESRVRYLETFVLPQYLGDESFAGSAWVEWWKMVPQLVGAAASSIVAPAAAVVAGQLGPQAAAPEEVLTVPGAYLIGPAVYSYVQESGPLYRELSQLRDRNGEALDPRHVQLLSTGGGALGAGMELIGLGKIAKFTGAQRVMERAFGSAVKRALTRPTFRRALGRFARDYAETVGTESLTEMGQELVPIFARALAKRINEGDWDREDWFRNFSDVADVGIKTFEGMALGGAFLGGPRFFADARASNRSTRNVARLAAMSTAAEASKVRERMPEAFRAVVERVTKERGAVSHIYISVDRWNDAMARRGLDPSEVAAEVLGDTAQYDRAIRAEGADLVVPVERWLEKVAGTGVETDLVEHVKFYQGDLSLAEAREVEGERAKLVEEAVDANVEEFTPEQRAIYDAEYAQILEAFPDPAVADAAAKMRAYVTSRLAERSGRSAADVYRDFAVRYSSEARGIEAPPMMGGHGEVAAATLNDAQTFQQSAPDTEAFRKWFGDSKVVDENGAPLVVYHGTGGEAFTAFDPSRKTTQRDRGNAGVGVYFSPSPTIASGYASLRHTERSRVVPAYLSIKNPLHVRDKSREAARDAAATIGVFLPSRWAGSQQTDLEWAEQFTEFAKAAGYDGVIVGDLDSPTEYVAFDPEQVKSAIGNRGTFDPDDPSILHQAKRAEITIRRKGGKLKGADIHFGAKADPSSIFHETAHFYLDLMGELVEQGASEELGRDYAAALAFLGVSKRSEIGVEQQERWAQAFESYLIEGKAPSLDLRNVFRKVKAWMLAVYGRIRGLVELNDEIRGVFDRLIASEQEIRAARARLRLEPLEAVREGLTPEELERRVEAERAAVAEDEEALAAELMADHAEMRDYLAKHRERITAEVEAEMATVPRFRALLYLQRGRVFGLPELPPGLADADGKPAKLSKALLVERYGAERLASLVVRGEGGGARFYPYQREGGADPDVIAPLLGFDSGDAMVEALVDPVAYDDAVREGVERKMKARFGDLLDDPGRLQNLAFDALARGKSLDLILSDLRLMRRKLQGGPESERRQAFDLGRMRDEAASQVAAMRVADLRPHVWLNNAARHGTRAFELAQGAKGISGAAYDAKVSQLWNMMLYRAARDAREEVESAVRVVRRNQERAARERIGKAGHDYLEQFDGFCEQFDFRPASGKAVQRRVSRREWVASRLAEHQDAVIPDWLLDESKRRHYRELSVQEFRDVRDSILNVLHLARLKNKLSHVKERREFAAAVDELSASAFANLKDRGPVEDDPQTPGEKRKTLIANLDARLIRLEELIERLDGRGNIAGPWHRYIWHPIAAAQTVELDLRREIAVPLSEAFEALSPETRRRMFEHVHIQSAGRSISRQAMLAIALNWGSASNRERVLRGQHTKLSARWSTDGPQIVHEILSKLSAEELQYVQGIWDTINSLWPRIEALEKRRTGIAPERVEALPFEVVSEDGQVVKLRGGYYPLVYNPRKSTAGQKQVSDRESVEVLFDHGYTRAMTSHGHTIERQENVTQPLRLDLGIITQHLHKVIHDLAQREAVIEVHRLLTNHDVSEALRRTLGPEYRDLFLKWVKRIANDPTGVGDPFIESYLGRFRQNMTVVALGFKATTGLQNFANVFNVLERVRFADFAHAFAEFIAAPRDTAREIEALSGEMRNRFLNLDRDMRVVQQKLLEPSPGKRLQRQVQRFAFSFMIYTDRLIAYPAWLGAYRQAVAEGKTAELAVLHADSVVRLTLTSAAPKDIAEIQAQKSEAMRTMTMFYSWFNLVYTRFRALGFDARESYEQGRLVQDLPAFLGRLTAFWIGPALVSELLSGRTPEDDEGWAEWAAMKSLVYPALSVPLLRDFASHVELRSRGIDVPIRYGGVPEAMESVVRASETLAELDDAATGDLAALRRITKSGTGIAGYWLGLPTAQANITAGYLWDIAVGETRPEDVFDFAHDVLYRRSPEELRNRPSEKEFRKRRARESRERRRAEGRP